MEPNRVAWDASWIWGAHDQPQWNYWLCFRKEFDAPAHSSDATLHITADSRYRVWLNGDLVGQGPARAFPEKWPYDSYPVGTRLRPGRNCIAVLVHEIGVGTFQYVQSRPGLLAQIDAGGKPLVATDGSWRADEHCSYSRETIRVNFEQGWAEVFDATLEPRGWVFPGFDDGRWERATLLGTPGIPPWTKLVPRPVPHFTEDPLTPVSLVNARLVDPPKTIWSVALRRAMFPGDNGCEVLKLEGYLATNLDTESPMNIEVEMGREWYSVPGKLYLNGHEAREVPTTLPAWAGGKRYRLGLHHGSNFLLWDLTGTYHDWTLRAVVDAPQRLTGQAPGNPGAEFVAIPVASDDPLAKRIRLDCRTGDDLHEIAGHLMRPIAGVDVHGDVVTELVAHAAALKQLPPEQFQGLVMGGPITVPPTENGDVEFTLDFGRMTAGYWELDVDADEGTVVDLLGFESFQDGIRDLPWEMQNTLRYKCRAGHQTYRSFLRHGARYVVVTVRNTSRPVIIHAVRVIEATYPVEHQGSFRCDDERLNRIWDISAHTLRLCMEDAYVDCPTYEQTFWVGDSRVEALCDYVSFAAYDLAAHSIRLAGESLSRSDLVESHCPGAWRNIIPAWSFLWALEVDEYYRYTGDRALLDAVYPLLVRQAEKSLKYLDACGLFSIAAWNLADWAPMDQPRQGVVTPQNMWLVAAWDSLGRLAQVSGDERFGPKFGGQAKALREAINVHLWNDAKRAYVDCLREDGSRSDVVSQQCQVLALLYDIAPPERATVLEPYLTAPPDGMVRVGTPFFAFFLLEALAKLGRHEDVLAYIRDKWGFMLDHGATTCWEMLPGYLPGGRWTRSHCHAWGSGPAFFLSSYQLGVRPVEPGFSRLVIAPCPTGLAKASGTVPTPHGPISVDWEAAGQQLRLIFVLPQGVEATVEPPPRWQLPADAPSSYPPGTHEVRFVRSG